MSSVDRNTCWSVRQCFERADALADELEALMDSVDELGVVDATDKADEVLALARRQRELIVHLAVNLRAGFALPPTPQPARVARIEPTPARKALPTAPPGTLRGSATPAPRVHQPTPRDLSARGNRADGLLTHAEAAARCGFSVSGWRRASKVGHVPAADVVENGVPLWRPEKLDGVAPRRARNAAGEARPTALQDPR